MVETGSTSNIYDSGSVTAGDIAQPGCGYRDLAPDIVRQRLVIEGVPPEHVGPDDMVAYLSGLSDVCDMRLLMDPVVHLSERFGWAAWVHWETSGAHLYAWDQPRLFLSVDIYTCKRFDVMAALSFTTKAFALSTVAAKEF